MSFCTRKSKPNCDLYAVETMRQNNVRMLKTKAPKSGTTCCWLLVFLSCQICMARYVAGAYNKGSSNAEQRWQQRQFMPAFHPLAEVPNV